MTGGDLLTRTESREVAGWSLPALAGRMMELEADAGVGRLSLAVDLIRQAQKQAEPVAWVGNDQICFVPVDVHQAGVDLAALPVLRLSKAAQAWKAADTLLRSGSFSLVVLDAAPDWRMSPAVRSLLVRHTRENQAVLLFLPGRHQGRGGQASLRARCSLRQSGFDRFEVALHVEQGRLSPQAWQHMEACHGPDGLC